MNARVLFVHNSHMPFVALDLKLLRERYDVTELYLKGWRLNPVRALREVARNDLVFGWFASRHSVLPVLAARLLGKPSLLVVGGYDVANLPEIGYGHQRGGPTRWAARLAISSASRLVAISEHSRGESVRNAGARRERLTVVYPGLDGSLYPPVAPGDKEHLVITVANVNRSNLTRKGLEAFVRSARYLPEAPFVLVGRFEDDAASYLRSIAPPNVRLTGFVADAELRDLLRRAWVYVQASQHEGFGLAMAEGMLSACVPVVSRVGAVPEVVGDAGIYLSTVTPEALADAIRWALSLDAGRGQIARERILREFPLENRRAGLYQEVDRLLDRQPQPVESGAPDVG